MTNIYDKSIIIQKLDEESETYISLFHCHAYVNKTGSNNLYDQYGATRVRMNITFEVRYFKQLEDIDTSPELYRVIFGDRKYSIQDYDDFKIQHRSVKLSCSLING